MRLRHGALRAVDEDPPVADAPPELVELGFGGRMCRALRGAEAPSVDERRHGHVERAAGALADVAGQGHDRDELGRHADRIGLSAVVEPGQLGGRVVRGHEAHDPVEPALDQRADLRTAIGVEPLVDLDAVGRAHGEARELVGHAVARRLALPHHHRGQREERQGRERGAPEPARARAVGALDQDALRRRSHRTVRCRDRRPARPAS